MNEELIQINKQILLKGLFAMNFPQHINEDELNQELDELEKKRATIQSTLGGMPSDYNKKKEEYEQKRIETKHKYDLNLVKNPNASITEKIEDYKEYKAIYDEYYDYIKDVKGLYVLPKKYDNIEYHYLITKI